MRSILLILTACFLVSLCGCCGQPTATFGLPTFSMGVNAVSPTTNVALPMRADYSGVAAAAAAAGNPCQP